MGPYGKKKSCTSQLQAVGRPIPPGSFWGRSLAKAPLVGAINIPHTTWCSQITSNSDSLAQDRAVFAVQHFLTSIESSKSINIDFRTSSLILPHASPTSTQLPHLRLSVTRQGYRQQWLPLDQLLVRDEALLPKSLAAILRFQDSPF